jgi:hypothetical protein
MRLRILAAGYPMGKEVAHDDRTSQGHTRRRSAVRPPNEPGVFGLVYGLSL